MGTARKTTHHPRKLPAWWYLAGALVLWLLMACGNVPNANSTPPTPDNSPSSNSPGGFGKLSPQFAAALQECGGGNNTGAVLTAPLWMGDKWVAVTENMVFAWGLNDDAAHPMALNTPATAEAPRDGYFYYQGHNIPTPFKDYITNHLGGWACTGNPTGTFKYEDGSTNIACQPFANLTLCYNYTTKEFLLKPLGKAFLEANHSSLSPYLPTSNPKAPGYEVLTSLTFTSEDATLHAIVNATFNNGAPPPNARLVVQIVDDSTKSAYYTTIRSADTLPNGTLTRDLPLSALSPGEHNFILQACLFVDNQIQACAEESKRLVSR